MVKTKSYKGIDVSLFQGDIDFAAVKRAGIDFVMIKASQGRTADYDQPFTDPKFIVNRERAGRAGLYWGTYHYLCARSLAEARAEAEYFVNLVKPYRDEMKLWCAVDVEDSGFMGGLTRGELTEIVGEFCRIVKAAGLRPMVYANSWWLDAKFTAPAGVPVWEANWSVAAHPGRAKIWQHTSAGSVPGIAGDVDMNVGIDIIGDANGDGAVTTADAIAVLKRAAGWRNIALDEGQADVNDDGYVTVADAVEILKIVAGR